MRFDVLSQGARLGQYEILGRIAVGGMAEIYLAGVEGFRKLVVIKRMLPEFIDNEEYAGMFLDEARLAARLHHPNVVEVYDIDQVDGQHFYAMEYLHGESAHKLLAACRYARREITYAQAIAIGIGVAAGLHHAHEACDAAGAPLGIVHRDVSPANIVITYDGAVKVVDFGVAKAKIRHSIATRNGTLKGKVAYMSPEQCRGDDVDPRSDVFSIGIVLYELTTGVRPFEADSELDVVKQILETSPIPPLLIRSGYPAQLERIVMRALARAPEDRYATAEELQRDLEGFARDEGLTVSPPALGELLQQVFSGEPGSAPDRENPYLLFSRRPPTVSFERSPPMPRRRLRPRQIAVGVGLLALLVLVGVAMAPRGRPESAPAPIIPRPMHSPVSAPTPPPAPMPEIVAAPAEPALAKERPKPRPRRTRPAPAPGPSVGSSQGPPRYGHF